MFGIGGWEMLLIGVVALLVFGPKRLPELARSMGKGLAEFRRASRDLRQSIDLDFEPDPRRTPAPDPATQPPAQAGDPASLAPPTAPEDPEPEPGHEDAADEDTGAGADADAAGADRDAGGAAAEERAEPERPVAVPAEKA